MSETHNKRRATVCAAAYAAGITNPLHAAQSEARADVSPFAGAKHILALETY